MSYLITQITKAVSIRKKGLPVTMLLEPFADDITKLNKAVDKKLCHLEIIRMGDKIEKVAFCFNTNFASELIKFLEENSD
jgi:hypothetical protein